ncbi:MAG: competence/damage-inducible protein A [Fusobacteriia bacterium 4572_132]|nr:MAG: competence/damage-inducible protein A [Fusobacteriia bacterium 4572_132]
MRCHIILIGTELLNGMMIDTNSSYMAEKLNECGIEIIGKSIVGDDIEEIVLALEYARKNSDFIIVSGGLGPTIDDITRDAIAKYLDKELILDEKEYMKIKGKFKKANLNFPERNIRQAMLPEGAKIVENKAGAAPAFLIDDIAVFPGVPEEVYETFPKFLDTYLGEKGYDEKFYIKDLLVWGLAESELENRILDVVNQKREFNIEFLVKEYGIIIRFIGNKRYENIINELKEKIYDRVGEYIFGEDDDRIEKLLFDKLKEKEYNISTAESCTGGLLASKIISLSGISKYYREGLVTYSNESKIERLGVKKETIEKYGAVSKETVSEMLEGLKTDTGIAISGIAGPTGGTEKKPVGTVIIGIKINKIKKVETYLFRGNREKVRKKAVLTALNFLRKKLK